MGIGKNRKGGMMEVEGEMEEILRGKGMEGEVVREGRG